MDLDNAAESAEPLRSFLEVGRNVMAFKSFSYHQCLLMIPIKGHLMPQQCIGGVLNPDDESLLSHHENLTIFQQDCAQFHATRQTNILSMCKEWMLQPWPAYGHSLIQLEHLWDQIGRGVGSRLDHPRARAHMIQLPQKGFEMIPLVRLRRFIRSMRYRCDAVIDSGGGYTRY